MSEKWSRLGEKLWDEARPIVGTPAEAYLKARGISLVPGPEILRFHHEADHPKLKQRFPAMIAKVIGSSEASFQVTYLASDGKGKAAVDKADQRRTLGANKFGVVGLAEVEAGACLLVGEGVESVASAMQASGLPGVAVLGIGGLANVEFSSDVVEIVVLGENDDASSKAIDKIAPALIEKGFKVRVAMPPTGFSDFNDVLQDAGVERGSALTIIKLAIARAAEWKPKRGAKPKGEKAERNPQSSFLVELAEARCELFTDSQGEVYASFAVARGEETHRETHKTRSKSYGQWLRLRYYEERRGSPSSEAMASAIRTIESKAKFDSVKHEVFLRVANLGDRVYIDMCDDHWRAIEIDADGWRIVDDVPAYFRREAGMLPLPTPSAVVPKEGIKRLNEVLRLKDEGDLVLIVHWALAALASRSPFTVLCFAGEPGATKTSAAFVVRSMVDPNVAPTRSRPKDVHEVFVAAAHSLVVGYNNLSHVPDWLSDAICVISEGSGESQREYFTNADEFLILVRAPFLITSIENLIRRGDLAQRSLTVHLAVPARYLPEEEFRLKFQRSHADVLGALCGAIAHGLKAERTLQIDVPLPRMATFYRWGLACEGALWPKGTFETAFEVNALGAVEDVIEGEKAAYQLRLFMIERGEEWAGTATQLLVELVHHVRRPVREAEAAYAKATEAGKYAEKAEVEKAAAELREARERARDVLSDGWPKAANSLVGKLKRASPALRKAGIVIEWPTRHGDAKMIKITMTPPKSRRQKSSPSSTSSSQPNDLNGLAQESRDGCGQREDDLARLGDDLARVEGDPARDGPGERRTIAGRLPQETSSSDNSLNYMGNLPSTKTQDDRDDFSPPLPDAASIVSEFDKFGFRIVLAQGGSLAIQDLWGEGRRHPRALPPQLLSDFSEHADAIGRWLEEGGTI